MAWGKEEIRQRSGQGNLGNLAFTMWHWGGGKGGGGFDKAEERKISPRRRLDLRQSPSLDSASRQRLLWYGVFVKRRKMILSPIVTVSVSSPAHFKWQKPNFRSSHLALSRPNPPSTRVVYHR